MTTTFCSDERALVQEAGKLNSLPMAVFRLVVQEPRLAKADRKLKGFLEFVADNLGKHPLLAPNLDALERRIEEVVEDPTMERVEAILAAASVNANGGASVARESEDAGSRLTVIFGQACLGLLREGAELARATSSATVQLLDRWKEEFGSEKGGVQAPQRFWYLTEAPPEVAKAIYAGAKASACLLTMIQAYFDRERLEAWLARGLLGSWVRNQKHYLTYLASLDLDVPKELVPSRMDLDAIYKTHIKAQRRLEKMARRSRETGRPVSGEPSSNPFDD